MKVALSVWGKRISPVLDSTRMLLIADIRNHRVNGKDFEPFDFESPFSRDAKLDDLGVRVLICGAVSNFFANLIETYGIQIISFITGTVDEVLDAYVGGTFSITKFRMPGCGTSDNKDFRKED